MTPEDARRLHRGARRRLAADRRRAAAASGPPRHRILSTACWRFPIFSQNFVYQELVQLLNRGHDVKFLYSELDGSHPLPEQFSRLWQQRRQMFLSSHVVDEDLAYFRRRMPERVDAVIGMVSDASGLTAEELDAHTQFRQSFSFARTAEAFRPDYLHSYFFYEGSLFTFVASQLLGIPRGISCYSDHILDDYELKVVSLQLRHSDLVIATSHRIKSELLSIAPGMDGDRIIVKPNVINAERFPVATRSEPVAGDPYRLVCVSRLDPKKGLVFLVRALRLLRDRGVNAELRVVGAVDPDQQGSAEYARALASEIAALDLAPWVHMEGRRGEDEVRMFLQRAHLFVAPFVELPSGDKDGIPTTILEAMATGLPVVATNAGSIGEVIDHGVDGVLVPQRRPEALADAIEDLLGTAARRTALGERAAVRVRSQFDVTTVEARFHAALDSVLEPSDLPKREQGSAVPSAPFPLSMALVVESRHPLRLPRATADTVLSQPVGFNLPPASAVPDGDVHASIVVVTHDNLPCSRMCLESVISNTASMKYEIVVVDDASTDGTTDYLRALAARVPHVRPMFNTQNAGFAPAVNQGLAVATADVLVLLHHDTLVPERWLTRLLRCLDDPSVGLAGPDTNGVGDETQVDDPYSTYAEFAAFAKRYGRGQRDATLDVRTLPMFCAAMRRDVYDRIGPLDDRFDMDLFVDDDYAMRVRQAGYAVRRVGDAYVHHFGRDSSGLLAGSGRDGSLFRANRRRWEDKWGCRWEPHQSRVKPEYEGLVDEVRELLETLLPPEAVVAVISKGDPTLLDLDGRQGWHFPQNDRGEYAGHYPNESGEAIAMLEGLRSKGAEFLVIPAPALWWLDHYQDFAQYLHAHFRFVSPQPTTCVVVDLGRSSAQPVGQEGRRGRWKSS